VFDICWSVGGRLFQAAGAAYENARWPNFNRGDRALFHTSKTANMIKVILLSSTLTF